MTQPVFSVIILAFNQENYISRAIESCLKQDFADYELIIVDDGSTDGTRNIIDEYRAKYKNIFLQAHPENLSSHVARCSGVEAAHGKYILFLDGDDSFCEGAFKTLYDELICKETFDVAEFSYVLDPGNTVVNPDENGLISKRIEYFKNMDTCTTIWNKLYETEFLKKSFAKMKKIYINMADDIYESICIAYYTEKYIQSRICIVKYTVGTGVSTMKHSLEDNRRNCKSISTVLHAINLFCQENDVLDYTAIMDATQKHLISFMLQRIRFHTFPDDACASYMLLIKVFSEENLLPFFRVLYDDALKYRNGSFSFKNFMKNKFGQIKNIIKNKCC